MTPEQEWMVRVEGGKLAISMMTSTSAEEAGEAMRAIIPDQLLAPVEFGIVLKALEHTVSIVQVLSEVPGIHEFIEGHLRETALEVAREEAELE